MTGLALAMFKFLSVFVSDPIQSLLVFCLSLLKARYHNVLHPQRMTALAIPVDRVQER
jgi:hypothetical protein